MPLHTPTMFMVIIVASILMGAAIAFIAHRRHPNLRMWAIALILHGSGYTLYSLRGQVHDGISIVLANILLSITFVLFCEGILRFQERSPSRLLLWSPVAIVAVSFILLLDNQRARFVLAGFIYGLQYLAVFVVLMQKRHETMGRGQYIVAAGALVVALMMFLRMVVIGTGLVHVDAVGASGPLQSYTFMASLVGVLCLSIGLVLMNQERAEQALYQEQQADQFRSRALEMLSRGEPLPRILDAMVRGIEQLHPGMLCSVLQLDRQGRHLADGVAPSLPDFYNAAINGVAIGLGVGSCGTSAFTGERVVVEDIATHPYWAPYKDLAARAGLGACWSQPIRSSHNEVLGTFAIYHRQPHKPTASDIALIEKTASLASIAIERSREEQALRASEDRYRRLVETANEGICVIQDDRIRFANPKLCALTGYSVEDLLGRAFLEFIHMDDREMIMQKRRSRLSGESVDFHYPVRVLTRHQGARWFELSGALFEWEGQSATLNFLADITDRRQMEERVRQLAYHDALTHLPNRRLLMDRLGLAMARHKRSGELGALMFMDLDNFKPLNDRHGHDAGDLLLVEVAVRLKACVREADTVARFGGDEFVVILSDLGPDEAAARAHAQAVADKILLALSAPYRLTVERAAGTTKLIEHQCSASIGVVVFRGEAGTEEERLKEADGAMYLAKQAGRHTIRFHEPLTA